MSAVRNRLARALLPVIMIASGVVGLAPSDAGSVEPAAWNETAPTAVPDNTPAGTVKVLTGDFTGDAVPDLLAIADTASGPEYWVGVFADPGQAASVTWTQWAGPLSGVSASTLVDNTFVGDGDPYHAIDSLTADTTHKEDVYLVVPPAESATGNFEIWFFQSTDDSGDADLEGDFFGTPVESDLGVTTADEILAGDFNSDDRLDFVVINQANLTWTVFKTSVTSEGAFDGFTSAETWHTGSGIGHIDTVGDFTGDGQDDILQIVNQSWRVARSSGDSFEYEEWRTGITLPNSVDVGDFSGDGYDDVLIAYDPPAANPPVWYTFVSRYGSVGTWFDDYQQALGYGTEQARHVGDYDGDGIADVGVVTSNDEPIVAFGEYDSATATPSFTVATSGLSLGTVDESHQTYLDGNDSHDLYLRTSTGNYFLTANDTLLSPTRVLHMNRPFNESSCPVGSTDLCGYLTQRDQFVMPNRIPFYLNSVDMDRVMSGYDGYLIADQCLYIWPKRYSVDSSNDFTGHPNRNREEHCSHVHQGTGDPANEAGAVVFEEPILVPQHADARVELHASAFISPAQPFHGQPHDGDPMLLKGRVEITKAGANPSNLGWILRLPESDEWEGIPAGATNVPLPAEGTVPWDEPVPCDGYPHVDPSDPLYEDCPFPNTEWGNTGTCNQTVQGVSFYNSFNDTVGPAEAWFRLYVNHADGTQEVIDFSNHGGNESIGIDGTVDGSYTSRNQVTFGNDPGDIHPALVVEPGAVVGVLVWHSNNSGAAYNADTALYLHVKKATDVDCGP